MVICYSNPRKLIQVFLCSALQIKAKLSSTKIGKYPEMMIWQFVYQILALVVIPEFRVGGFVKLILKSYLHNTLKMIRGEKNQRTLSENVDGENSSPLIDALSNYYSIALLIMKFSTWLYYSLAVGDRNHTSRSGRYTQFSDAWTGF